MLCYAVTLFETVMLLQIFLNFYKFSALFVPFVGNKETTQINFCLARNCLLLFIIITGWQINNDNVEKTPRKLRLLLIDALF